MTWVFVNLVNEFFDILCFIEKSSNIPSCNESLNITSFDAITEDANQEGVSGFIQRKHPWSHKLAMALGIEHSIPFASKLISKNC